MVHLLVAVLLIAVARPGLAAPPQASRLNAIGRTLSRGWSLPRRLWRSRRSSSPPARSLLRQPSVRHVILGTFHYINRRGLARRHGRKMVVDALLKQNVQPGVAKRVFATLEKIAAKGPGDLSSAEIQRVLDTALPGVDLRSSLERELDRDKQRFVNENEKLEAYRRGGARGPRPAHLTRLFSPQAFAVKSKRASATRCYTFRDPSGREIEVKADWRRVGGRWRQYVSVATANYEELVTREVTDIEGAVRMTGRRTGQRITLRPVRRVPTVWLGVYHGPRLVDDVVVERVVFDSRNAPDRAPLSFYHWTYNEKFAREARHGPAFSQGVPRDRLIAQIHSDYSGTSTVRSAGRINPSGGGLYLCLNSRDAASFGDRLLRFRASERVVLANPPSNWKLAMANPAATGTDAIERYLASLSLQRELRALGFDGIFDRAAGLPTQRGQASFGAPTGGGPYPSYVCVFNHKAFDLRPQ